MPPKRLPSCEPCRFGKLACDHRRPVCSRCIDRDIGSKCEYRKHPFKRARSKHSTQRSPQASQSTSQLHKDHYTTVHPSPDLESVPSIATVHASSQVKLYPNPGYQGSSSLDSVFCHLGQQELASDAIPEPFNPDSEEASRANALLMNQAAMIEEGVGLLDMLQAVMVDDFLDSLFSEWRGRGLESHLGSFLVNPFVKTITGELNQLQKSNDWRATLVTMSQRMFERGRRAIEITSSMTLEEFIKQFTEPNLRWETVGVILSLIGIAAAETRAPNAICNSEQERQTLRINMINCGTKCASFCESFDQLNDVQIIFLYQNFLLRSVFYGDQSYNTWHGLNDATNALLAAGLHQRSPTEHNLPPFLVEMRKRIFARVYHTDITMAIFLGRPPRMSKRFCTVDLPRDIDESLFAQSGILMTREIEKLDSNGWNIGAKIRTAAVLRWSMTTSMIREEILDLILGNETSEVLHLSSALRAVLKGAWEQLPGHLTVSSSEVWQGKRNRAEVESLHSIRLYYLQTNFLIEWAAWRHGHDQTGALFRAVNELLAWVNQALVRRESLPKLGFISFAWMVASCALPAAGALSLCLLQPLSRPWFDQLDKTLRRDAIENLCVLISHIDILHGPSDGNHQLFRQAKHALQSVVDRVLQPLYPGPSGFPAGLSTPTPDIDWPEPQYQPFNGDFWYALPDRIYTDQPRHDTSQ